MKLSQALRLSKQASSVAFVGSGGKTSSIFLIASELKQAIITTTTHLGVEQAALADQHFMLEPDQPIPLINWESAGMCLITGPTQDNRLTALTETQLIKLNEISQQHNLPLLIEADGSRGKPLKAPAEHEPAIPAFADAVVVTVGVSGLNQTLTEETVQRAEIFSSISETELNEKIKPAALIKVLIHPNGGLKNIPESARKIVLINQADTAEQQAQASQLVEPLIKHFDSVIIASAKQKEAYAAHENIAGVILAAGAASRFGSPKQLLDFHGQPFVRQVALNALKSGLSPIVVVVGAQAEPVKQAVEDLPVLIIENKNWQSGQASSIVAGVQALPHQTGAAIFLLADQPQIPVQLLRALIARHSLDLPPVLAPFVIDRRANPVLFDKVTFVDLITLQGDKGGRELFGKFSPWYLPWHDDLIMMDVDTPADYERLINETSYEQE